MPRTSIDRLEERQQGPDPQAAGGTAQIMAAAGAGGAAAQFCPGLLWKGWAIHVGEGQLLSPVNSCNFPSHTWIAAFGIMWITYLDTLVPRQVDT